MREQILEILEKIIPGTDIASSKKLVDSKVLDSLSLVLLVSELSSAFNVKIKVSDLTPENFNSLDSIVQTVQRLQTK